jgi:hypothetical protein
MRTTSIITTIVLNRINDEISNRDHRGNFQGNNFYNFNQSPLRELVAGQSRLIDQVFKKIASNDKILESISTKMDTFASAIKNQHSFNKMIEPQIT